MALKAVLDSVDGLDETLKAEYQEKDGKFYLNIESIDSHPQVVALKNAHERTKAEKTELKKSLDTLQNKVKDVPENFSIDEWNRLLTLDGIDPNDPDAAKKRKEKADEALTNMRRQYETQIENLKTKYNTDIATKDAETQKERELRAADRIELDIDKAMDKSNIDPRFRPAVRALHRSSVKHSIEEDGTIRTFFETNLGEVDPEKFLESWVNTDDGKIYVTVPTGPGGRQSDNRNSGGSGENPFLASSWNKTKQAGLRSDTARGTRLAQAAGFPDLETALRATRPNAQK